MKVCSEALRTVNSTLTMQFLGRRIRISHLHKSCIFIEIEQGCFCRCNQACKNELMASEIVLQEAGASGELGCAFRTAFQRALSRTLWRSWMCTLYRLASSHQSMRSLTGCAVRRATMSGRRCVLPNEARDGLVACTRTCTSVVNY